MFLEVHCSQNQNFHECRVSMRTAAALLFTQVCPRSLAKVPLCQGKLAHVNIAFSTDKLLWQHPTTLPIPQEKISDLFYPDVRYERSESDLLH